MSGLAYAVADTAVIAKRNLLRIPRQPDLWVSFTIQPLMFVLLFVYVFGGAIQTPGYDDYIDFLMPGIIVQTMAFGGFVTAIGLSDDLSKGLIDRFRSLPMARSAVLAGRTLADVATNTVSLVGDGGGGPARGLQLLVEPARGGRRVRAAAAVRLRVLVGVRVRRADLGLGGGRQRARLHGDLPAHVRVVRVRADGVDARGDPRSSPRSNPFSTIVDATRALFVGTPAGNDVWAAVAWCVGLIAVFGTLSVYSTGARSARSRLGGGQRRPALGPRLRLLQLRGHLQEQVLAAVGRHELNSDRQAVLRPVQRQRDRRLA